MSDYNQIVDKRQIPVEKRLWIKVRGRAKAFTKDPYGNGETTFYYGYCSEHKRFFTDYLHGGRGYLNCPTCL